MSQQQPNESKPSQKGGAGNASQKQDKSNEIIQKSGNQSGQQSGQDLQQKRDAHSNSASAGSDDDSADTRDSQHGSTKNLETEPDRASRGK
jgi:hypothetical protein